jgi:tetratricopeptide (TPR) repeat protein
MYLQSALELEWKDKNTATLADTYLNLCAVLSQLGRHNEALENALFSVTLLQEELLGVDNKNMERIPVLAIAYHNVAVELEFLKRMEECIATYEKATAFARTHLGDHHFLTKNL